jgi:predicted NBD/HSP70 family sugar kinase
MALNLLDVRKVNEPWWPQQGSSGNFAVTNAGTHWTPGSYVTQPFNSADRDRYDLPESGRAVLRALAVSGPATRPFLGEALALSKPTMSSAIAELIRLKLVTSQGSSRGPTGRSAVLYSVAPSAGHVLGIEAGATSVRVAAHRLDGSQIAGAEKRLAQRQQNVTDATVAAAVTLTERVRAEVGDSHGPLRDVVVAAPTLPTADSSVAGTGIPESNRQRLDGADQLVAVLPVPADVQISIANNVNCAAIAEHRLGVARDQQSFVYLQVGVKIGLGIVVEGQLLPGAHGAAGEVAMMPFPWSRRESPLRTGLEEYLGSAALMERCRAAWPAGGDALPSDAEALFGAAAKGNAVARQLVTQHALDIGRLVVGVMSVIDPGLVVLGGGVGQNQLVLPEVRRTVESLAWKTEITVGALGNQATVLGAVHLAISRALDRIA